MKRRSFLKIIGLAVAAPSSLAGVASGAAGVPAVNWPTDANIRVIRKVDDCTFVCKSRLTFAGWLRLQTPALQDNILGTEKAQLFCQKEYTPKLTGVFMSLDELRSAARANDERE